MSAFVLIVANDRDLDRIEGRHERGDLITSYPERPPPNSGESDTTLFYIYEITDENNDDVDRALFGKYNRLIDMTVTEGEGQDGPKTILVRNNSANVSQTIGGWTEEQTDNIVDAWNNRASDDPNAGRDLVVTGYPFYNVFECQGTFSQGEANEFERTVVDAGLGYGDRRSIYKFSDQAMSNLDSLGGFEQGTKAQFQNRLVDKRDT